jgi:hypothetical protein
MRPEQGVYMSYSDERMDIDPTLSDATYTDATYTDATYTDATYTDATYMDAPESGVSDSEDSKAKWGGDGAWEVRQGAGGDWQSGAGPEGWGRRLTVGRGKSPE